jgi:hypothetical protein
VHAFVAAILLGMARGNALEPKAEASTRARQAPSQEAQAADAVEQINHRR